MTPVAALAAVNAAGYGRVGPKTSLTGEIVVVPPSVLAAAAGVPLPIYTGGRLGTSEYGSGPAAALVAIVEAARNKAGGSANLTAMLTADNDPAQRGFYGRQTGRWASTAKDPTARTIAAARAVIEGGTNISGGAAKFFDPRTQDRGMQAGKTLTKDAVGVITSWAKEGWQFVDNAPIYSMGVNPYDLMVFKKVSGSASTGAALAAVERGRHGAGIGTGILIAATAAVVYFLGRRRAA